MVVSFGFSNFPLPFWQKNHHPPSYLLTVSGTLPRRRSLVVISGTGVSLQSVKDPVVDDLNIVTWKGLILHGIQRCEGMRLIDGVRAKQLRLKIEWNNVKDFIQVADEVTGELKKHAAGAYQQWMRDTFGKLEVGDGKLIDALARIASIYGTLNFDSLVEKRLGRTSVTWKDSFDVNLVIDGEKVEGGGNLLDGVLHLHGYWQRADSIVLGWKSYQEVIAADHAQAVQKLFAAGKTILLVGCGGTVNDPNFEQFFDACSRFLVETGRSHYILCRTEEEETLRKSLPAWLYPVVYGANYSDLPPFVERLGEGEGEPADEKGAPVPRAATRFNIWGGMAQGIAQDRSEAPERPASGASTSGDRLPG